MFTFTVEVLPSTPDFKWYSYYIGKHIVVLPHLTNADVKTFYVAKNINKPSLGAAKHVPGIEASNLEVKNINAYLPNDHKVISFPVLDLSYAIIALWDAHKLIYPSLTDQIISLKIKLLLFKTKKFSRFDIMRAVDVHNIKLQTKQIKGKLSEMKDQQHFATLKASVGPGEPTLDEFEKVCYSGAGLFAVGAAEKPELDPVNRPAHYTDGKIEVIDFIEDKKLGFHRANAIKYIARAGKKDPSKEVEDLKKAVWYLQRDIERLQRK